MFFKWSSCAYVALRRIHTSIPFRSLYEFFDDPKVWGVTSIQCGRPWRKDELRLKSNLDLHKLWYILLKERNMLMTMEEEHNRCQERLPHPERLEKVEESMENLMHVVEERNRAEAILENGEWIGPTMVSDVDALGRPVTRLSSEHTNPRVADKRLQVNEQMWCAKTVEMLRLEREKRACRARKAKLQERHDERKTRWNRLNYMSG